MVSLTRPSLKMLVKTQTGKKLRLPNFLISGQSFLNENCHNSRTSHDTVMKLEPVNKFNERNLAMSKKKKKKNHDQVMSANCELLLFFQFMANFLVVFSPKNTDILHTKNADINKIKRALVLKGLFFETTYVYLRTKFQVSGGILTSFRILSPPQSPPPPKKKTAQGILKKSTLIRVKSFIRKIISVANQHFSPALYLCHSSVYHASIIPKSFLNLLMPLSSLRFHHRSFTVFLAIFLAPTSSCQVPSSIRKFLIIISENNFFFNFIFPYLLCGSQYVEGLRLLKSRYLKQLTQFNKYSNQFVFSFPFRYSYPLNSLFIISTFSSFLWIVNIFNYRREFAEANEFLKK